MRRVRYKGYETDRPCIRSGELGKFNHDVTSRDVAFQDALLVVVKIAIQHGEVHTRLANPGAIMAGNAGAGKFDVLYNRVGAVGYPDAFTLCVFVVGV